MSTSRPFSYNTGSAIVGTTQVGSLAVGTPTSGFTSSPQFWEGPDEDLGYVIAVPVSGNTQPTPVSGVTASIGFFRTDNFNENSFIILAQYVSREYGTPQTFATGNAASTWLTANGYWNSWVILSGLVMQLDANNTTSYPGTGTIVYDLTGSYNHTLTTATFTTLSGVKCFNENSGFIRVNGTGPTLPTSGYTYVTWARIKTSSAGYRTLFRTAPNDHPILVEINTDNLGFYDNDTSSFKDSGYDVTPIEDVWVQYSVVGDNSSSTFYINGAQVGTSVVFGAGGNRHDFWGLNGQEFGYLANLYLYNRKLSVTEITQNYNALRSRF
jgi:hypothetical protein